MSREELKQDFALAIEQAIADPVAANLRELLCELERILLGMPQEVQLSVAGTFLGQLVEIYASRAEQLLDAWEEKYNPVRSEPIITAEMLQEVLRHTMTLNLDNVLVSPDPYFLSSPQEDSVVGMVSETNLLEFLNRIDQEQAKRDAFDVAHDEDITAWVEAIMHWMQQQQHQSVSIMELQRSLQMPMIEIWLALLLGGYGIEQQGDFYQVNSIWVSIMP